MPKAGPLGIRLFLEGIEVPIVSAQINIAPSKPVTASIQIVPTDAALAFKPRTLVHLYFLESLMGDQEYGTGKSTDASTAYLQSLENHPQKPQSNTFVVDDERYKLFYIGEVIGETYAKTPANRSMILQCMDLSSYWDTCLQWFANYSTISGLVDKAHVFVGAGEGLFDNITGGHTWVISKVLKSRPQTPGYEGISGLQGGMISLLETIGGLRPGRRGSSVSREGLAGVNDFFSVAEMRYGLTAMIGAVREDRTSLKIYSGKAFRTWLKNGMASIGNLVSYRKLVRQVGRWIFHDIYPNPVAFYYWGGTTVAPVTHSTVRDKRVRARLKKARGHLRLAMTRAHSIDSAGGTERALAEFGLVENSMNAAKVDLEGAIELGKAGLSSKKVQSKIIELTSDLSNVIRVFSDFQTSSLTAIENLEKVIDNLLRNTTTMVERQEGEHLFNQLLLPETFFVAPPKCNVIFPDQYTQFNYSRNFMREVTRLSVKGGMGIIGTRGLTKLLGHHYFAPNIKDVRGNSLHRTLAYGARVLLPHEVHSGIIPKFEWIQQGHRWAARQAGTSSNKRLVKSKAIPYVQRLSNFQFFIHRWASRTMSVNMMFNPYLVLGFPAVVFDRASPSPAARAVIESILDRDVTPTQFIGKIGSISHSISQQGGFTAAQMTQCRTHRGIDDEFLGILDVGSNEWFKSVDSVEKISVDVKKFISGNPNYLKEKRSKVQRLLSALAGGLTRIDEDATFMTRGELKGSGWSAREIKQYARPVGKKEATRTGHTWDKQYYEVPAGEDSIPGGAEATGFNFEVKESFKATVVEGVGVIKSVKIGLGKIKIEPEDLAKMGLVRPSEPTSGITKSIAVPAGDGTTAVWFPSTVTFEYGYHRSLGPGAVPSRLPFERVLMPGWYDTAWAPENIGEKVYKWLLGIGAITEDVGLGIAARDALAEPGNKLSPELGVQLHGSLYDLEDDAKLLTVEQAIDALSVHYMRLQEARADIHEFIKTYTRRPVANLIDIMGSEDHFIGADGVTVRGTEGFHSRAFGDYNVGAKLVEGQEPIPGPGAFDGLLGPGGFPTQRRTEGRATKAGPIPSAFDPRGPSRQRVRAYAAELQVSRGLKGS